MLTTILDGDDEITILGTNTNTGIVQYLVFSRLASRALGNNQNAILNNKNDDPWIWILVRSSLVSFTKFNSLSMEYA